MLNKWIPYLSLLRIAYFEYYIVHTTIRLRSTRRSNAFKTPIANFLLGTDYGVDICMLNIEQYPPTYPRALPLELCKRMQLGNRNGQICTVSTDAENLPRKRRQTKLGIKRERKKVHFGVVCRDARIWPRRRVQRASSNFPVMHWIGPDRVYVFFVLHLASAMIHLP